MNKIVLSSVAAVATVVIAGASWYGYSSYQVGANPDYICTATIVNPTCVAQSYGPWTNGRRMAYGTQQVSLSYSSHRVSCDGQAGNVSSDNAVIYNNLSGITNLQSDHVDDTWLQAYSTQDNLQYSTQACSYEAIDDGSGISTTTSGATNGGTGDTVESTIDPTDTATGVTSSGATGSGMVQ